MTPFLWLGLYLVVGFLVMSVYAALGGFRRWDAPPPLLLVLAWPIVSFILIALRFAQAMDRYIHWCETRFHRRASGRSET